MLAGLVKRMRDELGITGSIGLSHNKFLAKVASDLDKPFGFAVIGAAETQDFLRQKPVRMIWGSEPPRRTRWNGRASALSTISCAGRRAI